MTISIDPSLTGTAVCFQDGNNYDFFLIETKKDKSLSPSADYTIRVRKIKDEVEKLLKDKIITFAAMEGISFGSVGRIAELGALSYFLRDLFMSHNIPFIIIPPTVLKKVFTGKGNSNKDKMITEAENRSIKIPFIKKYKGGIIRYDDNAVDAYAISDFLSQYLNKQLLSFEDKIDLWHL